MDDNDVPGFSLTAMLTAEDQRMIRTLRPSGFIGWPSGGLGWSRCRTLSAYPARMTGQSGSSDVWYLERRGQLDIGLSDELAGGAMHAERGIPVDRTPSPVQPLVANGTPCGRLIGWWWRVGLEMGRR
jgi:hypothetical protein